MSHPVQPETLDLRSHDIAEDKQQELLRLFPEIRTEGGKIDFERLKLALGEMMDVGKERYGMNWPGKTDCFKTIQAPSLGTLRPCREESVNFDTTENLIIEGDNLEVLKLLQKSYLGKIKMIYIDPPYNTGNNFIYPDDYSESLQTYLEYTGQVDAEGKKFSTNTETDGRFHSKWLNMMYPRLYLARNLLREDGVIFISIDDNEVANLRRFCDEIFGEENSVGIFVINSSPSAIDYGHIAKMHDYVLCFSKNLSEISTSQLPEENKEFRYEDQTGPFNIYPLYNGNVAFNPETRPNLFYPFYLNPNKSGFPLTTPVEQHTLAGKTVFSVAGGALFICLERQLTLDLIRAMAEPRPERVVCLDNGFIGNDQLKANAVQIFKTKGVTSFKTV